MLLGGFHILDLHGAERFHVLEHHVGTALGHTLKEQILEFVPGSFQRYGENLAIHPGEHFGDRDCIKPETLKQIGIKVVRDEAFFVEPKRDDIALVKRIAVMAQDGIARAIRPSHKTDDGIGPDC